MNERLLQFIWQFQYFNTSELRTTDGEEVAIVQRGTYNTNQGPDFLDAKVTIGDKTWAGNIELHTLSSDWIKHNHSADGNYSNVILHVVWQKDAVINIPGSAEIPTIEMQHRVPKLLLDRYTELMKREAFVPCEAYLPALDNMKWVAWKERIAIERLQRKSTEILQLLSEANNYWEEVFWWKLAANFGIKVNADIFLAIAKTIPINILAKHKNQLHQLEALLLGQANLLNSDFEETYPQMLKKEHLFFRKKYNLAQLAVRPHFLRMRPANFPSIRLAQLAMLVHHSSHLFSKIREISSIAQVKKLFDVTANDYWHYHYMFDEAGDYSPKQLGKQMIENIAINTVVPVLFSYGLYMKDEAVKAKALQWLAELSAEKNTITTRWGAYNVSNVSALESQALIELKNSYCNSRRCLECAVGNSLMKTG